MGRFSLTNSTNFLLANWPKQSVCVMRSSLFTCLLSLILALISSLNNATSYTVALYSHNILPELLRPCCWWNNCRCWTVILYFTFGLLHGILSSKILPYNIFLWMWISSTLAVCQVILIFCCWMFLRWTEFYCTVAPQNWLLYPATWF